jgi:hypothetical protein
MDVHSIAREEVKKVLKDYFLGFEYEDGRSDQIHLNEATTKVVNSLSRLLATQVTSNRELGATIMTVDSSARTGKNGLPGIAPRSL